VIVRTPRLLLRPPRVTDAEAIFARYASDRDVTRYLSWPRHASIEQTRVFVDFSEEQWKTHGCGPLLIFAGDTLVGSTGLQFETAERAVTGYVLAKDAWGVGYATEALRSMIELARRFRELDAFCHVDNRASARVLEKCAFVPIARIEDTFPNLSPPRATAVHYRLALR
jgi:ribosomal-protein-alanine N-acetyltransferase